MMETKETIAAIVSGWAILASFAAGAKPVPFIPVFSDYAPSRFEVSLPVFEAGIPSYSVNSAMKPNPRPYSKSKEYPKKYVRKIEGSERRTTPYRFD